MFLEFYANLQITKKNKKKTLYLLFSPLIPYFKEAPMTPIIRSCLKEFMTGVRGSMTVNLLHTEVKWGTQKLKIPFRNHSL